MSAFAGAVRSIFRDRNMSAPAVWRPRSGGPEVALRVIAKSPDQLSSYGEGMFASPSMVVDVMVERAPGIVADDLLIIGGEHYRVQGEPIRDRERLVYTLDLRRVRAGP